MEAMPVKIRSKGMCHFSLLIHKGYIWMRVCKKFLYPASNLRVRDEFPRVFPGRERGRERERERERTFLVTCAHTYDEAGSPQIPLLPA